MVQTTISQELGLAVFRIEGHTTTSDIVKAMQECTSLPQWRDGLDVVIDQREMTNAIAFSDYELLLHVLLSHGLAPTVKHAALVSTHTAAAMASQWQGMVADHDVQFRAFLSPGEASDWLGVDETDLSAALVP